MATLPATVSHDVPVIAWIAHVDTSPETSGRNVQPIIHPAVPEHATRLRVFITINHTESLVRGAVDAIAEELAKL
jgi:7-keto-8-aminopelargonate synthetase-like enzyme